MFLKYNLPNGDEKRFTLEKPKITIGRGAIGPGVNVDLTIKDRLASRLHCSIEFKENAWHISDLQSRNGTYVNGQRIQNAQLKPGDRISIGDTALVYAKTEVKGTETVIMELKNEMDGGKGYKTMLLEIVGNEKKNQKDKKSKTDKISS